MINKIISNGLTGVDQAAFDVAIKLGIPYGGCMPKGREKEDGALPDKFKLSENSASRSPKQTEKNITDSDGTLIISHGKLTGDFMIIGEIAEKYYRPLLHVDLNTIDDFAAAQTISSWITGNGIKVLNISGPGAVKDSEIYKAASKLLETVLYLDLMGFSLGAADRAQKRIPKTVDDAASVLISKLSLRDKTIVANMNQEDLASIHLSLGEFITSNFALREGNKELLASCRSVSQEDGRQEVDAVSVIIEEI